MPDGGDAIAIRVLERIAEVPADQWDACAGSDNPFVGHGLLSAFSSAWGPTRRSASSPGTGAASSGAHRAGGISSWGTPTAACATSRPTW